MKRLVLFLVFLSILAVGQTTITVSSDVTVKDTTLAAVAGKCTAAAASVATLTCQLDDALAAKDIVVAMVYGSANTTTVAGCGLTWTSDTAQNGAFMATGVGGAEGVCALTVSNTGTANLSITAVEVRNTSGIDVRGTTIANGSITGGSTISAPSLTTTANNDLVLGLFFDTGAGGGSFTAAVGYKTEAELLSSSQDNLIESIQQPTAGGIQPTATNNTTSTFTSASVAMATTTPGGQVTLDTDNFTGTAGTALHSYSANWVNFASNNCYDGQISTPNGAAATNGQPACNTDYRTAATWTNDQFAQVTVLNVPSNYALICLRLNSFTSLVFSGYCVGPSPNIDGKYDMFRFDSGVSHGLVSAGTPAANDVMNFQVKGSSLVLKVNGSVLLTFTDTTYTFGYPGIYNVNNVSGQKLLGSWSAGKVQ
jgi:hypothetical protein